jgi:hypothetical protein
LEIKKESKLWFDLCACGPTFTCAVKKEYNLLIFDYLMMIIMMRKPYEESYLSTLIEKKLKLQISHVHMTIYYQGTLYSLTCFSRDEETYYYLIKKFQTVLTVLKDRKLIEKKWVNFDLIYMSHNIGSHYFSFDNYCSNSQKPFTKSTSNDSKCKICNDYTKSEIEEVTIEIEKIYEDAGQLRCNICYRNDKQMILNCGHFHTCSYCTDQITSCSMCKTQKTSVINITTL